MNIIVCVDENNNIGSDNSLLFNLKKDMEFFKLKTLNNVVIMGRKTFQSLPNSKPLPNRVNIVMTKLTHIPGCICVKDLSALFATLEQFNDKDIFVIGGQQIYNLLLPYSNIAYVTRVFACKDGDTIFPDLDILPNWELTHTSEIFNENGIDFCFTQFIFKKN